MLDKLRQLQTQYSVIQAKLNQPETYDDPAQVAKLNQELADLEPIVTAFQDYEAAREASETAEAMLNEPDPELRELAREEFLTEKEHAARLERQLQILLLPKDPNDQRSVIMEIRAGVGGEESALFAHSLYRMYEMYSVRRGWTLELASCNETELGGMKEVSFTISGSGAYSRLKYESGVHRVQRVPETESGGRVHTSTVTVAVLPEVEEVELEIRKEDIKMDVFRSSGAGGQHINKTSSAVRLTHLPTGMVVECQQERSQFQNRDRAMEILRARLYEQMVQSQADSVSAQRRSQVGSGMRNERIRTYNFPQGRVTDHRIGLTLYKIASIMDGDLDELIDALSAADQAEKLANAAKEDRS
ncbi:MAG: peptide chain release factor 1 [Clostridiales bacterium]|nr:peptide chain release factor 1 [Clostridiales bacterium]